MKLRTKVKRLHPDAVLPMYAKPGDAGFDLVAVEDTAIEPGQTIVVKTGLAFEIAPGYELQVRPRSGISAKTSLRVILGTVDSGFRGEVGVIVHSLENKRITVTKGTRIAQGVIAPVETATFVEVEELNDSERGSGGFGSTGVK